MSFDQPPPPGWQPPPQSPPPPSWGQPDTTAPTWSSWAASGHERGRPDSQAGYAAPVGQQVAHKPGAIPLRPLVLSDLFDGAFRIIRYNPRATIGAAVLVSAVAMVVPIAAGLASGSTGSLTRTGSDAFSSSDVASLFVATGGFLVGTELQAIGLLFVSGMMRVLFRILSCFPINLPM
ncbi:MAG: hypothetical protein QM747_04510, partial [Nocardioides sp.]